MAGDTMVIRGQTYDGWMAEIATLRAENERLRAALTEIADFPNPYSDQSCDQMLKEAKELAREALGRDKCRNDAQRP